MSYQPTPTAQPRASKGASLTVTADPHSSWPVPPMDLGDPNSYEPPRPHNGAVNGNGGLEQYANNPGAPLPQYANNPGAPLPQYANNPAPAGYGVVSVQSTQGQESLSKSVQPGALRPPSRTGSVTGSVSGRTPAVALLERARTPDMQRSSSRQGSTLQLAPSAGAPYNGVQVARRQPLPQRPESPLDVSLQMSSRSAREQPPMQTLSATAQPVVLRHPPMAGRAGSMRMSSSNPEAPPRDPLQRTEMIIPSAQRSRIGRKEGFFSRLKRTLSGRSKSAPKRSQSLQGLNSNQMPRSSLGPGVAIGAATPVGNREGALRCVVVLLDGTQREYFVSVCSFAYLQVILESSFIEDCLPIWQKLKIRVYSKTYSPYSRCTLLVHELLSGKHR